MIDTSEILVSKTHIEPLRDDGYVIYPVAYIGPVVGGKREAYSKGGNIKPSPGGETLTFEDTEDVVFTKTGNVITANTVGYSGTFTDKNDNVWTVVRGLIKSPALKLTWDDIVNIPVDDVSSVSDWNTFFDLPIFGTPFTSVVVIGNEVNLIGGSGIIIKSELFITVGETNPLLKIIDNANCVISCDDYAFSYYGESLGCISLTDVVLPICTSFGLGCFRDCISLENIDCPLISDIGDICFVACNSITELTLPILENLGSSVSDNNVFEYIIGQIITLTIPTALMTCNGGNPDGDIQWLQANNTVTIITLLSVETPYAILEVTIPEGGATLDMYYEGEATSIHVNWGDGVIEDAELVDGIYSHPYAEGVYQARFDTDYIMNDNGIVSSAIELVSLKYLDLANTLIIEPPSLTGLVDLQYLGLNNTSITDSPILTCLSMLQNLNLHHTSIVNPPDLAGLTNLQYLDFNNTPITKSPILTGLTNLQYLDFRDTLIEEPPTLIGLVSLIHIDLANTLITIQGLDDILTELTDASFINLIDVILTVQNNIRPTQSVVDAFLLAHPTCNLYLNEQYNDTIRAIITKNILK